MVKSLGCRIVTNKNYIGLKTHCRHHLPLLLHHNKSPKRYSVVIKRLKFKVNYLHQNQPQETFYEIAFHNESIVHYRQLLLQNSLDKMSERWKNHWQYLRRRLLWIDYIIQIMVVNTKALIVKWCSINVNL